MLKERLRGCVPLYEGDLMCVCGTFQSVLEHKTVPLNNYDCNKIIEKYPAISDVTRKRLLALSIYESHLQSKKLAGTRSRAAFTFRQIVNHKRLCETF